MIEKTKPKASIRLISSEKSWIEGEAIRQLEHVARWKGMMACVGLPDLHPGKGTPIGAAFLSTDFCYPTLIGSDIGCGIGLWQTDLKRNKIKRDTLLKRLTNHTACNNMDRQELMDQFSVSNSQYDNVLGTIGSGNHFTELQCVERIYCEKKFTEIGLDKNRLYILVHSGSRSLGANIFRNYVDTFGSQGVRCDSGDAEHYFANHNFAIRWAACNRSIIARQVSIQLRSNSFPVLDHTHNCLSRIEFGNKTGFLHRKGAVASDNGVVVIPGSRGTFSYLVEPIGDQLDNLHSLAHGAGRKWNRTSCKARLHNHIPLSSLTRTELGSVVICEDSELLYEEAPQAYKNIEKIIEDMEREKLLRVVATLRPVITYKMGRTL
jgi:release factor H-coupled RctB family protein